MEVNKVIFVAIRLSMYCYVAITIVSISLEGEVGIVGE